MKTEPSMPLFIGDYLSDTMGLSRAEHGSYMLLIMAYWKNGGPLPNDDSKLRNIALCPDAEWARTKGIMAEFFDVSNGCWSHKRVDEELAKSKERRIAVAEASAKGVQARRDLGQIPPAGPSVGPSVSPSVLRMGQEKELERVEKRLEELRNQAVRTATETRYSVPQRAEMKVLKERQAELRHLLKYVA